MSNFLANTEQHELLNNEMNEPLETWRIQHLSNYSDPAGQSERKQRLVHEIERLTVSRDELLIEAEQIHVKMAPLETKLENNEVMDADQLADVRNNYNSLKIPYDSRSHQASLIDAQITRREQLLNYESLMIGYTESMANWKADEKELNEKRVSLSDRLEEIQNQTSEDMAKARQAETDAATAYAQAVAWCDTEGEKNANANAQKAAKSLATATEHNRRQRLIITALEQELDTVDRYLAEAQKEHNAIERTAMILVQTVLEEQWNEQARALLDMGGKLWAASKMLGGDQLSLRRLVIPQEGEGFYKWTSRDLSDRSSKYTVQDLLTL